MIPPETRFRLARVPLSRILVTECQPRYPERLMHYYRLLTAQPGKDCGPVALTPQGKRGKHYTLLDGHHRYAAALLAGRTHLLAIIEYTPGQPGYTEASAPDELK